MPLRSLLLALLVLAFVGCAQSTPAPTPAAAVPTSPPATTTPVAPSATVQPPTEVATATAAPPSSPQALILTAEGQVQAISQGGDTPLVLTTVPTSTDGLALSPDGSRIAFVEDGALMVRTLADENEVTVTALEVGLAGVSWSPDSSALLYAVETGDGVSEIRPRLLLSALDGQPPREIAEGFAPAWSPDGKRIAFVGAPFEPSPPFGGGPGGRVVLADADGANGQQVGGEPVYPAWQPLLWSADGSRLAAGSEVIDGASGAVAWRTDPGDTVYISGIQALAPDGRLAGFWRNVRLNEPDSAAGFVERDELLLVGEDGQRRSVALSPKNECPCLPVGGQIVPVWSPGGDLLAVPVPDGDLRIFGGDGLPRGAVRLPEGHTLAEGLYPDASGRFLLATLLSSDQPSAWLIPLDGRRPQPLGDGRALGWGR